MLGAPGNEQGRLGRAPSCPPLAVDFNAEEQKVRVALARSVGPALLTIACCLTVFSPWVKTGGVTRSGYGLVRAVVNAGLASGAGSHVLALSVLSLPVLAGLSCALAALGAARLSAAVSGVAGAVVVALAACLAVAFGGSPAPGLWAGAATGSMSVVFTVLFIRERSPHSD